MDFPIAGLAAVCAGVFSNPLEVIKIRMQLQGELQARGHHPVHYRNVFHASYVIAKHDGVLALQAGLTPALWFQFFLNTFRLGGYDYVCKKGYTKNEKGETVFYKSVLAGGLAGNVGAFIASPFFLVKTHLQGQAAEQIAFGYQHHHTSMWSAFKKIFIQHGIRGLYRGSTSAMPRSFLGSTAQLTTFTYSKELSQKYKLFSNYPLLETFVASMISGIFLSVMITPFDLVCIRLYNQGGRHNSHSRSSQRKRKKLIRSDSLRLLNKEISSSVTSLHIMASSKLFAKLHITVKSARNQTKILVNISPTHNRKYSTRTKIIVEKPIVEIGGDEMSKVIFDKVKKKLIIPFVNLERDYYDCSLKNRNRTENDIVVGAIAAVKRYSAGVKCPTITPNEKMIKDHNLKQIIFPSPNVMIRNALDGTQLREPIICKGVSKFVPKWSRPIIMCRHTFGDQYGGKDIVLNEPGTVSLLYTTDSGQFYKYDFDIRSRGVAMLTYNTEDSIKSFAESCFKVALERSYPLYFTSKFTHLKKYDQMFVNVFQELYNKKYKSLFEKSNLTYEHRLVDDMAAYAIKSTGGFVWALKSYDGDVLSDIVGQGFGSMGMMTNTFISHDAKTILTEPAHGTITRHFKRHQKGKTTSTNPLSTIFAWTRCLRHRAQLDANNDLLQFADTIENCSRETVEEGHLTRDLALCTYGHNFQDNICIGTDDIIDIIADKLNVQFEKLFNQEQIEVEMTPS